MNNFEWLILSAFVFLFGTMVGDCCGKYDCAKSKCACSSEYARIDYHQSNNWHNWTCHCELP
jgi:hypothetical protein